MVVYGSPSTNSHQRAFLLHTFLLSLPPHTTITMSTMSSPTTPKRNQFNPSRPAPPPPSYTSSQSSHGNGPFTPYAPHHHHGYSSTSLDSASTLYTEQPSTPSTSSTHAARSPLNTLLSSPTRPRHAHPIRSISYPSATTQSPQSPRYLPAELSLFQHKPRSTLLADIELIIGKKLHFPMISPKKKEKKEKAQTEAQSGKLRKERRISDDDLFWSGVKREDVVVIEKRKGRGVREGNWV
jgi:hypothetical protein